MGFFSKKNGRRGRPSSTISQEPLTPMSGSSVPMKSQYSSFSQLSVMEEKDKKYKRTIRILRFISRIGSLILSGLMIGVFGWSLSRYYLTKANVLPSDPTQTAWPVPTILWPTYMMLGISTVTFFMNATTLVMYCFGVGAANTTNTVGSVISYILTGVHVLVWILGAGAYKMAEMKGNDLWGYSCSSKADQIEEEVKAFVSFGKLCTAQGNAWIASLTQTGLYLLTFIITIFVARRASTKKKLGKLRESVSFEMQHAPAPYNNPYMAGGYGGGGYGGHQPQETGTVYADGMGKGKRYMPVAREVGPLS